MDMADCVPPSMSVDYLGYVARMNGELLGQCDLRDTARFDSGLDVKYLRLGKLSVAVLLAACWLPAFIVGINLVGLICSKEEMIWVYAALVVAFVAYHHSVRDCPEMHLEGEPVYTATLSTSLCVAVPIRRDSVPDPFPTSRFSIFIDPSPKPLREPPEPGFRRFLNHFSKGCHACRSFVSNLNIFGHEQRVTPYQINLKEIF